MAQQSVQSLIKKYEKAIAVQDMYRSVHEAAYELAIPSRNLYTQQNQGASRMGKIFDSTGIVSANAFAQNMQDSITPAFKRWADLKAGPAISDEIKNDINEVLEKITEVAFSIMNASNFNTVTPQFYLDLCVGTGAMMVLPSQDDDSVPINFAAIPIEQLAIDRGPFGTVGDRYRTNSIPANIIKKTWPDAKIPSELSSLIEEDGSQEVTFIECFYTVKGKTYYDVIYKPTQERLVSRVFNYDPLIVTRINPNPIDVYGTGPLILATPDIRTLNKAKELMLRNAQLSVFGVWTVADNDVINPNTLNLTPGSFIPVARNAGPNGPSIAPLPISGNFNAQEFMIQELQANIRQMLFDDRLPPDTGPVRSPTEIVERLRNIRKKWGNFFGSIMREFVEPLWQAIISILIEKNFIALPPELKKIDNFFVTVQVLSPIAKEQALEDVQNLVQAHQIYASMAGPEAANMTFKMDMVGEWLGERLGVPSELMRDEQERQELEMQMQQAQQMQLMMQQAAEQQNQEQQFAA